MIINKLAITQEMKHILYIIAILLGFLLMFSCREVVSCPLDDEVWYVTDDGQPWNVSSFSLLGRQMFSSSNRIIAHQMVGDTYVIKFAQPVSSIDVRQLNSSHVTAIYLPSTIKKIDVPKEANHFKYLYSIVVDDIDKIPPFEGVKQANKVKNKLSDGSFEKIVYDFSWLKGTWSTKIADLSDSDGPGIMNEEMVRFLDSTIQVKHDSYPLLTQTGSDVQLRELLNDLALQDNRQFVIEGLGIAYKDKKDSILYVIDDKRKTIVHSSMHSFSRKNDETWLSQMLRVRDGTAVFTDKTGDNYIIVQPQEHTPYGLTCRAAFVQSSKEKRKGFLYSRSAQMYIRTTKCRIFIDDNSRAIIDFSGNKETISAHRDTSDSDWAKYPIICPIEIDFNCDNEKMHLVSYWLTSIESFKKEIDYYYSSAFDEVLEKAKLEQSESQYHFINDSYESSPYSDMALEYMSKANSLSRQIQNTIDPNEKRALINERDYYLHKASEARVKALTQ